MNTSGKPTKKRSFFRAIFTPLLVLLLAEALLLMGVIWSSGAITRIDDHEKSTLDRNVADRSKILQNRLQSAVEEVNEFSAQAELVTRSFIAERKLNAASLGEDSKTAHELLDQLVDPIIETLTASGATGFYLILNTDDLAAHKQDGAYGSKQAIYICDTNSLNSSNSAQDDLVFACAPSLVLSNHDIQKRYDWAPELNFEARSNPSEYDFFATAFLETRPETSTSAEVHGSSSAYWSIALFPAEESNSPRLAYSVPLLLEDGSVFGVAGIELSEEHLRHLLPYDDLGDTGRGLYVVAAIPSRTGDAESNASMQVEPILCRGINVPEKLSYGNSFLAERDGSNVNTFHSADGEYFVSIKMLNLLKDKTGSDPRQWALVGMLPQTDLQQYSSDLFIRIGLATLLMLAMGLLGSFAISKNMSRPLENLSHEVSLLKVEDNAAIELSETGVDEIDQLTDAISTLSKKVFSANRLMQERLQLERDHDPLTGLINRRAFTRLGEVVFSDPSHVGHAAVVMADLDNLKNYNDTFGHSFGDVYIQRAAQAFSQGISDNTLLSRVSGDEFFMLFYGYETKDQLEDAIARMWKTFQEGTLELPDGTPETLHASGGVALYLQDSTEFNELMNLADFAMYQVKRSGKNNIAYFDLKTYQEITEADRESSAFSELMDDPQLVDYHFQPIVNMKNGDIYAYEALMRVRRGPIKTPSDVIRIAQRENRQIDIERTTWNRTLECFEVFEKGIEQPNTPYLFINSLGSITLPAEELRDIAEKHSATMGKLVVEITEMEEMSDKATDTKRAIPGFTGMFALDDYGSGYHSENALLRLRPQFVKMDMSIVRGVQLSADKQMMVSHIVEYAHSSNTNVIAEGVETLDELKKLIELGVDYAQGFLFAQPAATPSALNEKPLNLIRASSQDS
ncbi:MAG: GGDEF and EAL domain-containing protein [Eggerthellaceae bacterium]|nr:GGDEF and EAL domain-containing protein [Eggerthellaceae bacterium]